MDCFNLKALVFVVMLLTFDYSIGKISSSEQKSSHDVSSFALRYEESVIVEKINDTCFSGVYYFSERIEFSVIEVCLAIAYNISKRSKYISEKNGLFVIDTPDNVYLIMTLICIIENENVPESIIMFPLLFSENFMLKYFFQYVIEPIFFIKYEENAIMVCKKYGAIILLRNSEEVIIMGTQQIVKSIQDSIIRWDIPVSKEHLFSN